MTETPRTTAAATSSLFVGDATCAKTGDSNKSAETRAVIKREPLLPAGLKPYYLDEKNGIAIVCGDCREILPTIKADCVVTDPPYGLGDKWTGGTWFTRGVYSSDKCAWDSEAPHAIVADVLALGLPSIVWGGNYFAMPPSRCWLAWVKANAVPTMADMELAWTNIDRPAQVHNAPCGVRLRAHPTEKPLSLMRWCLGFMPEGVVLDPFMGSGTTLRAAKDLQRVAIGIEIEERYCEIAAKRLAQEVLQFP